MSPYKLIGKIVKVEGECVAEHKVGEEFDLTLVSGESESNIKTHRAPEICGFLYNVAFPYIMTLQFGGEFPWETDKDVTTIGCPDNQKVVIEIRRIKE